MFCKNCGAQIEANAAFCKECGTKVENIAAVQIRTAGSMKRDYFKTGGIAASLFLFFSALLPYCNIRSDWVARELGFSSFSLVKAGDDISGGIILLILTALIVLFICLNKKVLTLIVGILNLVILVMSMLIFNNQISELEKQLYGIMGMDDVISKGVGYYMLRMACIIFLAALLLYVFKKREMENSNC